MKVKCTSIGCCWINELGSLEKHLEETCGFVLMPCANGCDKHLIRSEHPSHCTEECPLRWYTCEHCSSEGTYKEMTGGHLDECPDLIVPCPNNGCGVSIKRKQMASHHLECPYATIDCPYKDVGCTYISSRYMMAYHKTNSCDHHLDLAMLQLKVQDKKISGMEILHNQQKCAQCVIRMPRFNVLRASNEIWYSPGFYTHTGGYKMCLCVYANGDSDVEGTHVSVFMYLMKGENDNTLTWPIRYKCTITLLNQLRDEGHYTDILECLGDESDEYNHRVISGEQSEDGWGSYQFIPHDSLGLQEDNQCQYLKDDSLYFRVQVEFLPGCKPWLMVTV